ncbi:MAG: glycosyltransferase, partial [Acidobacteria bacterium]|nr:glycosyltransferase [Acidobacteriota bacterium]
MAKRLAAELVRLADVRSDAFADDLELSLVFPIYNEEENIPELYRRVTEVIGQSNVRSAEIIFVNDGSRDKSE